MNREPRKNEWYSDPKGSVTAGWGLCLSARDLARIGELVINRGEYRGKRIVSENYLQDMTAPHIRLGERFGYMSFGYLWYRPFDDRQICAAIGDGGNIIYADNESRISVGMTGTFKPRIYDRVDFIERYVLPVAGER
jgi:CubicO group peptidase (beta-lactamase class C family)